MQKIHQAIGHMWVNETDREVVVGMFLTPEAAIEAAEKHYAKHSARWEGNADMPKGEVKEKIIFTNYEEMMVHVHGDEDARAKRALARLSLDEQALLKKQGYLVEPSKVPMDSLVPELGTKEPKKLPPGRIAGYCYHDDRYYLWNSGGFACNDCGQNDWVSDLSNPKKLDGTEKRTNFR